MRFELTPRADVSPVDARARAGCRLHHRVPHRRLRHLADGALAHRGLRRLCAPAAQRSLVAAGARRQGDAAGAHRHRPLLLLSRQSLEHRRRGPVRHRRRARQLARAAGPTARRPGFWVLPAHAAARHHRRRALRADPGLPEDPLRRQRDPDEPDAGLCRAAHPRLSGARALARSEGLQLPAIGDLRSLRDAAIRSWRAAAFISAPCSRSSPCWSRP